MFSKQDQIQGYDDALLTRKHYFLRGFPASLRVVLVAWWLWTSLLAVRVPGSAKS